MEIPHNKFSINSAVYQLLLFFPPPAVVLLFEGEVKRTELRMRVYKFEIVKVSF